MKKSTKITAFIAALVCAATSMSSCAMRVTNPVTVDGIPIRAGLYILKMQGAIDEAKTAFKDEQPDTDTSAEGFDYLKQVVGGVSFSAWVENKTDEYCREYAAIERLYEENGLTLPAETVDSVNSEANSLWTEENTYAQYFYGVSIIGEYYEKQGVGEQSYKEMRLNSEKRNDLFDHLYGEGGTQEVPAADIDARIAEDYLALNYFEYELENGNGASSYADRIISGESYEEVYRAYSEDKERESIQKEMDEAKANGEEYEGESLDSVSIDVPAADSQINIIKKDSGSPSESFIEQASAMANGETKVITVTVGEGDDATTTEYVVSKADISAKSNLTESYRDTVLHSIKDDDFNKLISDKGAGLSLTTDGSKSVYTVSTVMKKSES